MEALLSGHIANLIKHEHQLKNFIRDKSAWIGFIVGIGTFLSSVVACFYSTGLLVDSRLGQVRGIQDPTAKASYLAELIAAGVWPRFFFSIICFLFISFVVSVALGIWSGFSAENQQPSFLLLSKQAEKLKQKTLTNYKRAWMWFVLSIAGAIIIELVGNTLFTRYLEKWVVP